MGCYDAYGDDQSACEDIQPSRKVQARAMRFRFLSEAQARQRACCFLSTLTFLLPHGSGQARSLFLKQLPNFWSLWAIEIFLFSLVQA